MRMMPTQISGLLGNHFFQVAALIHRSGGDWALPPEWETPLLNCNATKSLLVAAENCPSIWNTAPYLRGPFRFEARCPDDRLLPPGSFLTEKSWSENAAAIKNVLGYNDQTKANARAFIGDADTACAIHLRRGEKKELVKWYGFPFECSYTAHCLRQLPPGVRVFVFSDEPEWAKNCLHSIGVQAQDGEAGVNHTVEAMARMSACRYLIGANSTMSWWAGYLNEHPRKRVFMPGWRRLDHSNCDAVTRDWPPQSERDRWTLVNVPRKLGIIIAAHRAERFIEDCLRGMRCLEPTEGWEYDIRIGADGCFITAGKLAQMGVPFYWSETNVGAYIIRNSLIAESPCDAYCIFDADDVPMPEFARRSIATLPETGICTCSRQEVGEHLQDIGMRPYNRCYGRAMFTAEVWAQAGGFRPERCDSDGDFVARLKDIGYNVGHTPPPYLMLRRQHPGQLTRDACTRLGGEYRNQIRAMHKAYRQRGEFRVSSPVRVPLLRVEGDWERIPRELPVSPILTRRKPTVDAVILYRHDGGNELPYCVEGLRKCAEGIKNIYVIGDDPQLPGVIHIPQGDPNKHNKEANMIRKVLAACDDERISDPFLLCANDEIFIRPVSLKTYPLYYQERKNTTGTYGKMVSHTRALIEATGLPYRYYDGHTPIWIHKRVYREAMALIPWDTDERPGILCRTPYGCLQASKGVEPVLIEDPKRIVRSGEIPSDTFLLSMPNSVTAHQLRAMLAATDKRVPRRVRRRGDK